MSTDIKKIRFNVTDTCYIEIMSYRKLQHIDLDECFRGELLCGESKFFILNEESISSQALRRFDEALDHCLCGNLELHESIQEDIGYLWNDFLETRDRELAKKKFSFTFTSEGHRRWVGLRHYLWQNPGANLAFWLYAKMGKFFIELTPEYPWALCEPEPGEVVVPYDEFMKNYKPILILEIPRETLVRWKRQTNRLMRVVESNEKRIRANFFANRRTWRLRRLARLKRAVR